MLTTFLPCALRKCLYFGMSLASFLPFARAEWTPGRWFDGERLTLGEGFRQDFGPFFYRQQLDTSHTVAAPPLFSYTADPDLELEEFDLLYPVISYDRFGSEYRFHIFQLFSFAGGENQEGETQKRFSLFPFYFQQRSSNPGLDYTAFFPIYGTLRNRLFRDEIHFVLFPGYSRTRKKDVVTDNYLFPIFHLRHGNQVSGWQVWPLTGAERKEPTTRTNAVDEIEVLGGYRKFFILWPFFFNQRTGLGTTNEIWQQAFLPLYTIYRSPLRDSSTWFWPFGVTITDDREKKFHEVGAPWPLVDFARGEGKTTSRIWPLFSRAHSATLESDFYLWPVYKLNRITAEPLFRERIRILFFLYSDVTEKNTQTGAARRRTDLWPLFTAHRDFNGQERMQILTILEPLLPNNKSIERNYSPLWALWRSEKDPARGRSSQSLLWNLYRQETDATGKKVSLFFGLFRYQSGTKKMTTPPPARREGGNERNPGAIAPARNR